MLLSVLETLCVSLLSQDKIMFRHGFMRFTTCVPLVSYLVSLSLSQIQMLRQRINTVWYEKMLLVIHGVLN